MKRRHLAISPITRRILAVNILALLILAGGLLYLGEYREGLITSELASLNGQARIFAAALGESAVTPDNTGDSGRDQVSRQYLVKEAVRRVVLRLVETTGIRARLFDGGGVLLADSRVLMGGGGMVQVETLPPPAEKSDGGFFATLLDAYDRLADGEDLPLYSENPNQKAADYKEAMRALGGEEAEIVRADDQGGLVLSAAVPVQRYKQVLGALMLTKGGGDIEAALLEVRLNILAVFGVALAVTILLSLYLAGTIARPLHKLAAAAEHIRRTHGRADAIPPMEGRNDEIGNLAASLRDMTEALWRRMDAIESFAADVAHEIKNPLTSLQSAVETAVKIEDPERQRRLMAIIADDVARLNRLISDISDASRLDSELSRAKTETVDLGEMLATIADIFNARAKGGEHRVEVDCADGLIVMAIGGRLSQVFANLIENALSFSPPGGPISIRARGDGEFVTITIDDDGPGLADGKEEAIFERFYSERPAGEKFGTHSGLGLSISKQIVETLSGSITAENRKSEDGAINGARLTVRLPAV